MAGEPRHRFLLKRRIAFEQMRDAAIKAANAIAPRLHLLRRLSVPATEEFLQLESALQLAVMATRRVEDIYRDAWANEPAPTEVEARALSLLDRKVSRWSVDLATWIESEISERELGGHLGESVGDWIEWGFCLDVEIVISAAVDPVLADQIPRPCMCHRIPGGRVRTLVLLVDQRWDSLIQFARFDDRCEVASRLGNVSPAALSSDLLKELLLFIPEVAYLAESVEIIRLRTNKRQLEVFLAG